MSFEHDMYLHYNYVIIVLKDKVVNEKRSTFVDDTVSLVVEMGKVRETRSSDLRLE